MIAGASIPFIVGTTAGIALGWGVYQACQWADHKFDNVETDNQDKALEVIINDEEKSSFKSDSRKKPSVRTEPKNLEEQLALEEARRNPGKEIPNKKLEIKDPRNPKEEWSKQQYIHEGLSGDKIKIHYWENRLTQERHGFKFKDDFVNG